MQRIPVQNTMQDLSAQMIAGWNAPREQVTDENDQIGDDSSLMSASFPSEGEQDNEDLEIERHENKSTVISGLHSTLPDSLSPLPGDAASALKSNDTHSRHEVYCRVDVEHECSDNKTISSSSGSDEKSVNNESGNGLNDSKSDDSEGGNAALESLEMVKANGDNTACTKLSLDPCVSYHLTFHQH